MDHDRRAEPARPARGALALLAPMLLAGIALLGWAGRGEFASHRAWWSASARAHVTLPWQALHAGMTPEQLAERLGGPALACEATPQGRRCTAPLARADGLPAAALQAQWTAAGAGERLAQLELLLPWWQHHAAARALLPRLGGPTALLPAPAPQALLWQLPQGQVRLARAPGWNPWHWTVLRWQASPP